MNELRKWNPALIITLVERHEYATSGVPQFEKEMKAFAARENVVWEQAPISDGGVPDAAFEKVWLETGRAARMALRAGRNVLLHCRAGLGRTGMMAARLLAECGVPPSDAMILVRSARPRTIERGRQEDHVRGSKAIADATLSP